jgi:hypothetical protein
MVMARAIKKYGWNTYVGKDTGCVSMCAVIWLAGKTRFINEDGRVGFHSASNAKLNPGKRNEYGNAMMFSFYHELGASDKAARVFMAANPDDAIWLTDSLAKSLDIGVVTIPAEALDKPKDKPPLDKVPGDAVAVKLAKASATPELPATDAGDAGPPPVKPADLAPVKPGDLVETRKQAEQPRQTRHERPQPRRRYAGGGGGRTCSFSVPMPYIGGITVRGRC